ncbi:MAG: hypothetical protein IRZ10_00835 [Thermoflavifilum sp.]|nr:hypothetical protein [Thermoflavifilum sp.]MCL6512932.1 hypothetical protein [Alicyclobacillus sp.]
MPAWMHGVWRRCKTVIAAVLFSALVLVGAISALSAAAAWITTLSQRTTVSSTSIVPASGSEGDHWTAPQPPVQAPVSSETSPPTDAADDVQDTLQSPVTAALDQGGVVLGERVQTGFGHFVARLFEVLFLEEPRGTTP